MVCVSRVQLSHMEGSVHAVEKETRELSRTSAIRESGVDFDVVRRRRRLQADLDSLLDKIQGKRDEFAAVDKAYVRKSPPRLAAS